MQFGGSPNCTSCGKAVYHAEQVSGPGRRIYHKLCLKCVQCGKRLDPGGLVEHDLQPYCARCHTQHHGTRDLRNANLHPASPSAVKTPTRSAGPGPSQPGTPLSPSMSPTIVVRPRPSTHEFYTPPRAGATAVPGPEHATSPDPDTPITRPNFRDARPISVPFAGGAKALDERGLLRRAESPRSKVGDVVRTGEECQGCGKRVYAAEVVHAIGHKWHRACLRCTACKSTIDPSKVSDRENQPYCKNCYNKQHGPGGIMGKR